MENYLITASKDGSDIDFETELHSTGKPKYYDVYKLCINHGCPLFYVSQLDDEGNVIDEVEW